MKAFIIATMLFISLSSVAQIADRQLLQTKKEALFPQDSNVIRQMDAGFHIKRSADNTISSFALILIGGGLGSSVLFFSGSAPLFIGITSAVLIGDIICLISSIDHKRKAGKILMGYPYKIKKT